MDVTRHGFLARSVEDAEQHFRAAFRSGLRLSRGSGSFEYALRMAGHQWFLTGTAHINGARVVAEAEPLERLILNSVDDGRYDWRIGSKRGTGSVFVIPPGHGVSTRCEASTSRRYRSTSTRSKPSHG